MGNYFSKSFNIDDKDLDNKKNYLTDYDLTIFNKKRENIFKGTIAICVLYAIIALVMFLGSYLSETIKSIILYRFLPFTIVFIIGTLIIIFYLAYQVMEFKPIKINRLNEYDPLSCPDYWKLEKVNIKETSTLFDPNLNKSLFQYRCVLDENLFNKGLIAKSDNNMKISNSGTQGDIINIDNNNNYNTKDYTLYKPMNNLFNTKNNDFNKFINKEKTTPFMLGHANMIMNNFGSEEIKSNDKNSKEYIYDYKLSDRNTDEASLAQIKKLTFAKNNSSTTQYDPYTADRFIKYKQTKDINTKETTYNWNYGNNKDFSSADSNKLDNIPLVCDKLYPLYMANLDKETRLQNKNIVDDNINRCAYSKACNVSWSDLNCEKYEP